MVYSRQPPCEVIRLLVGGRDRDAKANAFRSGGHGRHHGQGFVDGPLRTGADGRRQILGPAVHVVAAKHVGDEHAVEVAGFEELGKGGPVLDVVEVGGFVGRVPP